jgi:hypothetical protein
MRMTPTVALEDFLGLPPLHLKMEAEAWMGIYRHRSNKQWRPKFIWYWHAHVSGHEERTMLNMGADKMIPRYIKETIQRFPDSLREIWGPVWYTRRSTI